MAIFNASSQAIILHSCPKRNHKAVLLDNMLGKIDCIARVPLSDKSIPGSLIEYSSQEINNNLFIIKHIDLIALPNTQSGDDIFFLHHILELCNIYVPYSQGNDIFKLLLMLYQDNKFEKAKHVFSKKVMLYKILLMLGMFPETESSDYLLFSLISCSEDSMFDLYNIELEKKLDLWLYRALVYYNAQAQLKTFLFLKNLGIVSYTDKKR